MTFNEIIMSLEVGLIYGIVALGLYLTFRVIDFPDLTCDGSFVLGSATASVLIQAGVNPWLSLLAALCAGALAGMLTAILYLRLHVTNLLAGILVSFMLYSINLRIMGGLPNISLMDGGTLLYDAPVLQLLMIACLMCALLSYLLLTDFGLSLRCIGFNTKLASNSGVNVAWMTMVGLALSNALVALGGGLFSQHQGFADVGSGVGTIIIGLASVMLGEKILPFRGVVSGVLSCLLGSVMYRLFIGFALHSDALGLSTSDLNLVTGLMVMAIMVVSKREVC